MESGQIVEHGPVAEVFADPQIAARNMVTQWQHPVKDDLRLVSSPIRLSLTPVRTDLPPPQLGQHTDEVLHELLGQSEASLAELRRQSVI